MLGAGSRAQMVGVMSLHPLNKPHSQPGGQIRILAVGFMSAPPAWIAEIFTLVPSRSAPCRYHVTRRALGIILGARSVETASPTFSIISSSKAAAIAMACGNTVAVPARAIP